MQTVTDQSSKSPQGSTGPGKLFAASSVARRRPR